MTQVWGVLSGGAGGQDRYARGKWHWRMPVAAAGMLAVLVVSGCAGPAEDGPGPDRAVLAGGVSESPEAPTGTDPSDPVIDAEPAPGQSPAATPVGGQPWDDQVSAACAQALAQEGEAGLRQVAQSADPDGATTFWSGDTTWALCDSMLGSQAPAPAVVTGPAGEQDGFDEGALRLVRTDVDDADGTPVAVRFVAGGRLPWPVHEISYTFPDGHTERARFVRSDDGSETTWWSVTYTVDSGVLVDPDTDPADLAPLVVSVTGAAAEGFRVSWDEAVAP